MPTYTPSLELTDEEVGLGQPAELTDEEVGLVAPKPLDTSKLTQIPPPLRPTVSTTSGGPPLTLPDLPMKNVLLEPIEAGLDITGGRLARPMTTMAADLETGQSPFDLLKAPKAGTPPSPVEQGLSAATLLGIVSPKSGVEVQRGLRDLAVSFPEFLTSPVGVATAGVGAGVNTALKAGQMTARAAQAVHAAIAGGFALDTIRGLIFDQAPELAENWSKMSGPEKWRASIQTLGSVALAGMLVKHAGTTGRAAIKGGKPKPTVGTSAEPPVIEPESSIITQLGELTREGSPRKAVLIPQGQPGAFRVPPGMESEVTKQGSLIYDPTRISKGELEAGIAQDILPPDWFGMPKAAVSTGNVVLQGQKQGVPVVDIVADTSKPETVKQAEQAAAKQGDTVVAKTPEQVKAERIESSPAGQGKPPTEPPPVVAAESPKPTVAPAGGIVKPERGTIQYEQEVSSKLPEARRWIGHWRGGSVRTGEFITRNTDEYASKYPWRITYVDREGNPISHTYHTEREAVDILADKLYSGEVNEQQLTGKQGGGLPTAPKSDERTVVSGQGETSKTTEQSSKTLEQRTQGFKARTPGATTELDAANTGNDFRISTPDGSNITGYFDGEIFYVESKNQRKRIGTSLMLDALRLLAKTGNKTVTMVIPKTEGGKALVDKLVREGYISKPTSTKPSGTTVHGLLINEYGKKQPAAPAAQPVEVPNAIPQREATTVPLEPTPGNRPKVEPQVRQQTPAQPPGTTDVPAKETVTPQTVKEAFDAYDDTGTIQTVGDLANAIEGLIGEGKAPESLQRALDKYRKSVEEGREYGQRGGLTEEAEERFLDAVEKAANKPIKGKKGVIPSGQEKEGVQAVEPAKASEGVTPATAPAAGAKEPPRRKNYIELQREREEALRKRADEVAKEEAERDAKIEVNAKPVIDALKEVSGAKNPQSEIATDRGGNIWNEVLDQKFTQEQLNAARVWLMRHQHTDTRLMRAVESVRPKPQPTPPAETMGGKGVESEKAVWNRVEQVIGKGSADALKEARSAWNIEKDYEYRGLERLKQTVVIGLRNAFFFRLPVWEKIVSDLIEGRKTILDKLVNLEPIKESELNKLGTYPSAITKFGYERGDRGVYTYKGKQQPPSPPPPPTGQVGQGTGAGPGARTAGTPPTGGSEIEQLASSFATKAPTLERARQLVRESFSYGERTAALKDSIGRALGALANAGRALWTSLSKFDKPDDLLKAKGVVSAELEKRGWRIRQFDLAVRRAVPDVRRRNAMAKWIDAGGDDAVLARGEAATKPQFKQAYRDARNLTPDEKIYAQNIANYFEARLQEAIDAGVLEHGLQDYIHRIYPRDSTVKQKALAYVQSGILSKNPSLAKKRFYEFDWEAEAAGLRPVQDFLPRLNDYEASLSRAIAAREFVGKATTMTAPDGRPIIGIKGVGIPIEDQSGVRTGTVIKPIGDFKKANQPGTPDYRGDYKIKEYPSLSRWKWVATDTDGKPIFVQGDVAIHPDFVSRFEALLEPSHVRFGANEKLNRIGRGALSTSSTVKQTMLSLSGFHQVQIGVHAMEHRVMPWQVVKDIDFENPKVEGLLRGGVTLGGEFRDAHMGEGLFGTALTKHIPILGPLAESYQSWLFQSFIPRVKMTMALHALERNRSRFAKDIASGKMTESDLNHLTAQQANAAFGELNYMMMERNKTVQDVARLTLLAPDFLEARGRFVAQSLTKYGTEQRVALALGAITLYTLARILNKFIDDQYHFEPENLFSVVYKGRTYSLRTVQGDVLHLVNKPIQFWINRLNPVFGRTALELVTQRDVFGRKRTLPEIAMDSIKNVQPISTRSNREQKLWESILNAFGGTVRRWNDVDKAYRLAQEWKKNNGIQERGEFIYDADKDPMRPLKIALSLGDADAVDELAKFEPKDVQKFSDYFRRYVEAPFTGKRSDDAKWMATLTEDQKATVVNARNHRRDILKRFLKAKSEYEGKRGIRLSPIP